MSSPQRQTVFELLREPIPDSYIKTKQARSKGGQTSDIRYISWYTAIELLDDRAPGWTCEIKEVGHLSGMVFVRVALTIEGVTRENVGCEDDDKEGWGDSFSNAYGMAIRRAAVLFGLGRELYDKSKNRSAQPQRQSYQPPPPTTQQASRATSKPSTTDRADLINGGQMNAIRQKAGASGFDVEDFIQSKYEGRSLDQLTYQEAVTLISNWPKSS